MAEVVHPELQLEAVLGPPQRWRHQPGVVDQDVDRLAVLVRERPNRVEIGKVERAYLDARTDLVRRLPPSGDIAHRNDHLGAGPGQPRRGPLPDPAVAAGDHDPPSGLVGKIGGGPGVIGHGFTVVCLSLKGSGS